MRQPTHSLTLPQVYNTHTHISRSRPIHCLSQPQLTLYHCLLLPQPPSPLLPFAPKTLPCPLPSTHTARCTRPLQPSAFMQTLQGRSLSGHMQLMQKKANRASKNGSNKSKWEKKHKQQSKAKGKAKSRNRSSRQAKKSIIR